MSAAVELFGKRIAAALCIATVAALALAGSASAAFSEVPTRAFPIESLHAVAADGTLWTTPEGETNVGSINHFDDEGHNLGDGFTFNRNGTYPLGIGYFNNRVYLTVSGSSFGQRLLSYQASSIDPAHDPLPDDEGTSRRIGGNQAMLRVLPSGDMTIASGQENKVGILNAGDLTKASPFYPQGFYGVGINKPFEPVVGSFESCVLGLLAVPVNGEGKPCGTESGRGGIYGGDAGFNYPNDVAPGLGGFYVSEKDGDRIAHVDTISNPGARVDFHFGVGPGSGAGQLDEPQSIVRQPGTGNLFVSEGGNRRISVFNAGGGFIAAFGYGVLDGADAMQVCGIEIGPCKAGVAYQSDPRSYFSRLDFSPDGELYAYMPLLHQIQVFAVSGAEPIPSSGGGGGGGSGGPGGSKPGGAPAKPNEKDKVRLSAQPLKVERGKKTTLTAIVNPPASCRERLVLFQAKAGRSWDSLGRAVKPGKACTAKKRQKIEAKSVFRVVLVRASNQATLGYSPNVTVKLK